MFIEDELYRLLSLYTIFINIVTSIIHSYYLNIPVSLI